MAARARGGTGVVVALVIFVILFMAGAGAAIVAYTNYQEQVKLTDTATTDLKKYVLDREQSLEPVRTLLTSVRDSKSPTSVVGILMSERERLMRIIEDKMVTIDSLDGFLVTMKLKKDPADSNSPEVEFEDLFQYIGGLRANVDTLATQRAKLVSDLAEVKDKLTALEKAKGEMEAQFRDADQTRAQLVTQIGTAANAAATTAQKTFADLKTEQETAAAQFAEQVSKLETELATLDAKYREQVQRNGELMAQINPGGAGSEIDASTQVDGRVLSTIPQDNLVTIDLGKNDRVLIGLTFEVFDRKKGVTKDQFNAVRGKATIEVSKVKDRSSECRVVRLERGATVFEDDIIANVVYDKYRTFRFYVYGEFDIDNDGRPTASDTRRIKSMIQQWGGIVVDKMTYEVDFLVLGKRPEVPGGDRSNMTPDQIEAIAALEAEERKFIQLEGEARLLRIPILNQNRFLTLVGHYERWEK
ncbi:MAG: hypothetical protein WD768_22660 [Phycisphaeraceae bacterium]